MASSRRKKTTTSKKHYLTNRHGLRRIQGYFQFDKLHATIKKELLGGLTTFLALIYILSVNPTILNNSPSINPGEAQMNYFGIFLSTAIVSFFACFIMGLFANVPIAMATTMGMNTIFSYSIASMGLGFQGAMIACILSSLLFVVITLTPLKQMVIQALPTSLVLGFTLSLGFFITYVGIQQIGWVQLTDTGLPIASLSHLKTSYPMILIGMGTLILMFVFHFKKIPGGIIIALVAGFVVALIIANAVPQNSYLVANGGPMAPLNFRDGHFNWHYDWSGFAYNVKSGWMGFANTKIWTNPLLYASVLILTLMMFFDGLAAMTLLLNQAKVSHPQRKLYQTLKIDAFANLAASTTAISPVGATLESSTGISQGAKTGLAAIITGIGFLIAIPLYPIFALIPTFVSGAACVFVGTLIVAVINRIDWTKVEYLIPILLTVVLAMVTFTLINGIAIGIISYVLIMTITGKYRKVSWLMWPLSLIMIAYFISFAFVQK